MTQESITVDVLVVGTGASGMSTAITAASNKLDVLVVEKQPQFGGTTARSGGWLWIPGTSLANRFVTYRLYWDESQMRFTVVDNGVERNMYDAPLPVNSTALQAPFYLLLNLAVGGNFTDSTCPRVR